jgi:glycerol-3-phosphate O-acyltransferase/dihydroxyacetone phosphate acyltransferase
MSEPSASEQGARRPRLVGGLARLLLFAFFRSVEVQGLERIPRGRPMICVGNHVNSLLDPALLIGYLPIAPRFLAKSTLWKQPFVRVFLELAAAIPIYRKQDEGVDTSKNAATFAACHEVLRAGGTIAIFPEGVSHDEPALVPLKTGVSRILLEAEQRFGPLGACILPVGLTFEDKTRFRSRALVHVGPPIEPAAEIERHRHEPEAAVRALTDKVRAGLEAVTINYPSWDEARLIQRAAEIYSRPVADGPGELPLRAVLPQQRDFIEGYRHLLAIAPAHVHEVAAAVRDYDDDLRELKLADAQVAALYPARLISRYLLRTLAMLVALSPFGLVGTAINFLPYHGAGALARRIAPSPDTLATYKLFASLVAYPSTWILLAVASLWLDSPWVSGWHLAVGLLIAGPMTGYLAVRWHQRIDDFVRQARAFLLLRSGRFSVEKLKVKRRRVLVALNDLIDDYQRP